MCMEPLLRNIDKNNQIECVASATLQSDLPKTYAYADDVNATIKDTDLSLKALFLEYERLTRISGLELNADKTELLRIGSAGEKVYEVEYMDTRHQINSCDKVKINGIFFQKSAEETRRSNVESAVLKIEQQFRAWSKRSLSTLGKILIVKCFGISQIIFLMQSMELFDADFKKINSILFKFIWNRRYQALKAPERIKRLIVNTPLGYGGLGMIDIEELDSNLKLKALGRLLVTRHPFLGILRLQTKLENFFMPSIESNVETVARKAIDILKADRDKLWSQNNLDSNRALLAAIREMPIRQVVESRGINSLPFFNLWQRGARKVKDLDRNDIRSLHRHISLEKIAKLNLAVALRIEDDHPEILARSVLLKNKFKQIDLCTSKEIREGRSNRSPILDFKIGMQLDSRASIDWGFKVKKLTSTKHKNTLMRVAHGDIYTKDKLFRFGMEPSNICPRCDQIEDLKHKFINCPYVTKIWQQVEKLNRLLISDQPAVTVLNERYILGAFSNSNKAFLTLTAEILGRIIGLRDENYLIHPKHIVKNAIKALAIKERDENLKALYLQILGSD